MIEYQNYKTKFRNVCYLPDHKLKLFVTNKYPVYVHQIYESIKEFLQMC